METARLTASLPEFVHGGWTHVEGKRALKWNWHLDALCKYLQDMKNNVFRKLVWNVPPRTSKSTIATIMLPCWLWAQDPWLQFMFASYSFSLSRDHAYKRRALLESSWYQEHFPNVKLRGDRNNIMEMATESNGIMYTTSVGGSTTGRGGDYLFLDDPNSVNQMESDAERATLLAWLDTSWATRANDAKTVRELVIQQRTHTEDVSGHVLAQGGWRHVKIPMEYDPKNKTCPEDPRKIEGELLDPERFPTEYIEEQKKRLGPYGYAGQYAQEPAPLGGGIVKRAWIRHWRTSEQPGYISIMDGLYQFDPFAAIRFCVVDPAITGQELADKKISDPDYTVITAWVCFKTTAGPALCLMDLIRERMEGPDIVPRLEALHRHWRFQVIGIETVAFQKILFQDAKRRGLPVREISTKIGDDEALYRLDKDKLSRLIAATPLMADPAGRFYVPEYAPWLADFLDELTRFPVTAHDDQVDCVSVAVAVAEKLFRGSSILDMVQAPKKVFSSESDRRFEQDKPLDPMDGFFQNDEG